MEFLGKYWAGLTARPKLFTVATVNYHEENCPVVVADPLVGDFCKQSEVCSLLTESLQFLKVSWEDICVLYL